MLASYCSLFDTFFLQVFNFSFCLPVGKVMTCQVKLPDGFSFPSPELLTLIQQFDNRQFYWFLLIIEDKQSQSLMPIPSYTLSIDLAVQSVQLEVAQPHTEDTWTSVLSSANQATVQTYFAGKCDFKRKIAENLMKISRTKFQIEGNFKKR